MRIHTSILVKLPVSVSFDYNPDSATPFYNLNTHGEGSHPGEHEVRVPTYEEFTEGLLEALSKESKSWKEIYDDYIANEV